MITEIKKFRVICDLCDEETTVEASMSPSLPKGWTIQNIHVSNNYNITRKMEVCPSCTDNIEGR